MFKENVAKIFNRKNTKVVTITTNQVVLEALCAYRDQLIMSEDIDNLEVASKLSLLHLAIEEAWLSLPIKETEGGA